MEEITSRSNPLVVRFRKLAAEGKVRRREGFALCEGPKMLAEAMTWGVRPEAALVTAGSSFDFPPETRVVQVPEDLLRSVAPTQTPQKVLFTVPLPLPALPDTLSGSRYLVLDGLQDPGNLGTLWRTADAFGADGLLLLPGCADPWSPKVLRSTMGACFRLPLWQGSLPDILDLLARTGLPLYGTALREDTLDVRDLEADRWAMAIGSEGRGLSLPVLDACAATVKIPMTDRCESLNAAAAGAVVLWELARGRL